MTTQLYRFGLFELNPAARQLLKQGRRVRLQEQPLRALEMLLEQPGRLVTREELRCRLWPEDVHVDFELGLTGAIKRLRSAIDDSADNPRFVETVPKVGYRFVAPVRVVTDPAPARPEEPPATPGLSIHAAPGRATHPEVAPASGRALRGRAATVFWAALALGSAAVLAFALRPMQPLPRVTRIARLSSAGRAWPQESLLCDGARLYYTEFVVGTGFRLRQILLNGNEDTVAEGLPTHTLFRALSPDHTTFLAISQDDAERGTASPVWTVPVVGGPLRRLGRLESNDFGWSPDGEALAFAREDRLFVARADGGAERAIGTLPGYVIAPRWSPDGRRLRFTVLGSSGDLTLWESGAGGEGLRRLPFPGTGAPMEGFGEWTADGRHFVFMSRREGTSNLWIEGDRSDAWHRRRTEPVQLTAGPISYSRPLPGRDGRIFALGTEAEGELSRYERARGKFVPFLGGRSAEHLDFSRDGRWVAYVAYPEGTLWRARADGSAEVRLTDPPLRVFRPQWSPDGRSLLFTGVVSGAPSRLYSIAADGGSPEPLLAEPAPQSDPIWSPSGDAVVYGRGGRAETALCRLDLRRRRSERIPGTEGLHAPLSSPDGRHLVARSGSSGRLFLVDSATGRSAPLTARPADYAAWSADSQYVYFNSMVHEQITVFRVHVPDGAEEKIAILDFKPAGSYGTWTGLAPDGSPLALRDRGRTDVYALTVDLGDTKPAATRD